MAIELSTAGIIVKWAVEATAGIRPTTGYAAIRGIKSIPEFNPEPNMLDCTPLEETEFHRSIPGLRDLGGVIGLTVNDYDDFRTDWTSMLTAYTTAASAGKGLWIEYYVPGLSAASKQSWYFSAVPSTLGFGGAEVDGVLENVAYLTPNKVHGWDAKSTT